MNTMDINFLILSGDGINCERETKLAIENAGGVGHIIHINDLLEFPDMLLKFDGMAIPGGFSFGDELGSGQILALKIRHGLMQQFETFIANHKPIIGICNGFQVLVKLGAISSQINKRTVTLTQNRQGHFIDKWVSLKPVSQKCIWTKNLPNEFPLPIRHGEGRLVLRDHEVNFQELIDQDQIALVYTEDVNGSHAKVAGLCDQTGLVFGLMPHPEAYLYQGLRPGVTSNIMDKAVGQIFFENAINYIKEKKQ